MGAVDSGPLPEKDAATGGCPSGSLQCAGSCVDTRVDKLHCGACGHACALGEHCEGSFCTAGCAATETVCGGGCANLKTDVKNCGACGKVCPDVSVGAPAATCEAGVCRAKITVEANIDKAADFILDGDSVSWVYSPPGIPAEEMGGNVPDTILLNGAPWAVVWGGVPLRSSSLKVPPLGSDPSVQLVSWDAKGLCGSCRAVPDTATPGVVRVRLYDEPAEAHVFVLSVSYTTK